MESLRIYVCTLTCVFLVFVLADFDQALAYTISGTIYGGGSPQANATVVLTNTSNSTQTGSIQTATNGTYSFTNVNNGPYNLAITPSVGSVYASSPVNPLTVSGFNITQDVILMQAYSVSGTVRSTGGAAASNIVVYLYSQGSSSFLANVTTDANGAYSFTSLSAGTYALSVKGGYYYASASSNVATPYGFAINPVATNIAVAGAATQNITLPAFATLSGRTTDNNGTAVGGVNISVASASWAANGVSYSCRNDASYPPNYQVNSDVSGNYSLVLLPYASYVTTLTPPTSNKTVLTTTINPMDGSTTATKDLKMTPAYSISGTVRSTGAVAASNIVVYLYSQGSSSSLANVTTDANGAYSFTSLSAGTYALSVKGGYYYASASSNVATPYGFAINPVATNIAVAGAATQNITLPAFATLSGRTTDNNGTAVGGVNISVASASWAANGVSYSCRNDASYPPNYQVNSDVSGNYSLLLLPYASYSITITPPTSSKLIPATISPFSVMQNTLNNVTLIQSIASYKLSTTVLGANGHVTSTPIGINCNSGACSWYFDTGTQVTLTASHIGFLGWSGACTGTGDCVLTMSADTAVTANYPNTIPPTILEIYSAINMFLGLTKVDAWVDLDGTGNVTVSEVQKAINAFLGL